MHELHAHLGNGNGAVRPARAEINARLLADTRSVAERLAAVVDRLRAEVAPAPGKSAVVDQLKETLAALARFAPPDVRPPLFSASGHPIDRLRAELALSQFELDLLVLAALPEEHECFAAVLSALHPRGEPKPTAALAAQLFCRSFEERLYLREVLEATQNPLRGALRLGMEGAFFDRSLLIAPGLWSALHGFDAWPEGLRRLETQASRAGLSKWLAGADAQRLTRALGSSTPVIVLLTADTEETAFGRAVALVEHAGLRAVGFAFDGGIPLEAERLLTVHAIAQDVVPVLRMSANEVGRAAALPSFDAFSRPVVIAMRQGVATARGVRPIIGASIERLSASERAAMWSESLPELSEAAPELAARYSLEPHQATAITRDVRCTGALETRPLTIDDVALAVRARSGMLVSPSVNLVRPRAVWKDLVLPRDRLRQLSEAVERLQQQSRVLDQWGFLSGRPGARGVRLLLSGPPGTGKTLSAEILAGSLGVDLLSVDISRIVSKWIGETEKNLAEVFEVAERSQAVLFFDEADALFGKRTEVQDAHDRYANLETAYLLSRLERFEGLAVLATNLRQSVDPAFMRRIEFVIDFEEPNVEERGLLWRHHIPKTAPLAKDVDLGELASIYAMVGGLIRNAAVAAGFLAATAGSEITRRHLVHAIRREYEKSGRAFPGLPTGMTASELTGDPTLCRPL